MTSASIPNWNCLFFLCVIFSSTRNWGSSYLNGYARKSPKLLNLGRPVAVLVYPWITGSVEHYPSHVGSETTTSSLPLLQKLKFLVTEKPHSLSSVESKSFAWTQKICFSMSTSLICHLSAPPSSLAIDNFQGRQASPLVPNTFLHGTKIFSAPQRRLAAPKSFQSVASMASDHVPKQFRQENLKDGCESWLLSFSLLSLFISVDNNLF